MSDAANNATGISLKSSLSDFGKEHGLTPRELDIVGLLIDKIVSVEGIAEKLSVSPNTVKNHFQKIFQKTKTNAKAELLANFIHFVVERGGVEPVLLETKHLTILLADDDPNFGELLVSAFDRLPYDITLKVAQDGVEVIDYVSNVAKNPKSFPSPDLILLDIKMPRMDGYDVLKALKANPDARNIPVIALSGSDDPEDVKKIFELGGTSYIKKPHKFQTLTAAIDTLIRFFAGYAELPRGSSMRAKA